MYFASNIETVERVDIKVLIVGAGPAGIGTASALKQAGVEEMLVVDLREIGSSFLNWPKANVFPHTVLSFEVIWSNRYDYPMRRDDLAFAF
jgi:cation diffusion facilitator CzcD-associated flavoprotein CzcO